MIARIVIGLALAAGAAPAVAQAPTSSTAPVASPATPTAKKDQILCRQIYRSGSRIPTEKKCMTRGDWDKLKTGREEMDAAIRASLTRNGGIGG